VARAPRNPTRAERRWAPRLRTLGALLLLLGAVAIADQLIGLAAPAPTTAVLARERIPLAVIGAALAVGAALFWLGRRWS
jgi:hypothetical protein